MNKFIFLTTLVLTLTLTTLSPKVFAADVMSSTNYTLQSDSVNFAGANSESANYKIVDTIGEPATGVSSTTNSDLSAGYEQTDTATTATTTPTSTSTVVTSSNTATVGLVSSGNYVGPILNPSNFLAQTNNIAGNGGIMLTWINPADSRVTAVRVIRSDSFFPHNEGDGQLVYEGSNNSFLDTTAVTGKTYYYAIFAESLTGAFSSGVLTSVHLDVPGQPSSQLTASVGSNPFVNAPQAHALNPIISKLTLNDFEFIQQGNKILANQNDVIDLDGGSGFTLRLPYNKVPEILKTIAVSLTDPNDSSKAFIFLLRANTDKSYYEANIGALNATGTFPVAISILDYQNQSLKQITGSLYVEKNTNNYSTFVSTHAVKLFAIFGVSALLILSLIFLIIRRKISKNIIGGAGKIGGAGMIGLVLALLVSGSVIFHTSTAYAAFNPEINYQAKLANSSNVSVPDGSYDIVFKLYTTATGGSPVWTESDTGTNAVTVKNGLFSVMLGSITPIAGIDFNQTYYLGVTVGADSEMAPRKIIGVVPAAMYAATSTYATTSGTSTNALNAETLQNLTPGQLLRSDTQNATSSGSTFLNVIQSGAGKIAEFFGNASQSVLAILSNGNVGIGSSTPSTALVVNGTATVGNVVSTTTATSTFGGSIVSPCFSTGSGCLTSGSNYFTNSGATTTLNTGSVLSVGNGYFGGDLTVGNIIATGTINNVSLYKNGYNSVIVGQSNTTSGDFSSSFGTGNASIGYGSYTFGAYNNIVLSASSWSTAVGANNTITASPYSYAFGHNNNISTAGGNSIALGSNNVVLGTSSVAIGNGAYAPGDNMIVLGTTTTISTLLNGNVGIGTTSPSDKLEVAGNGYFSGNLTASNISATTMKVNGGLSAGDSLEVNGTIDANYYNVSSFGQVLDNNGNAHLHSIKLDSISNSVLAVDSNGNVIATSSTPNYFTNSGATTTLTTGTNLAASVGNFGTVNVTSTTGNNYFAGNVGIGTSTPFGTLAVAGPSVSGTVYPVLNIVGGSIGTGPNKVGQPIILQSGNTTGFANGSNVSLTAGNSGGQGGNIILTAGNGGGMSLGGSIILNPGTNSGADGYVLLASSSGMVGIGTSSPSNKLEVAGNGFFTGNLTASNVTATGTLYVNAFTVTGNNNINTRGINNTYGPLNNYTDFFEAGSIQVENKAQNGWLALAARDTTGTEAVYNLSNIGNITASGTLKLGGLSNTVLAVDASGNVIATTTVVTPNYFTNSGATTTLTTGTNLAASVGNFGTVNATSTTGTSVFAGNVGIGSSSPSAALSVLSAQTTIAKTVASLRGTATSAHSDETLLDVSSAYQFNTAGYNLYGVKSSPTTYQSLFASADNNYAFYGNPSGGGINWGIYLTGEDRDYFSGKVGIGTSTPSTALSVIGTTTTSGLKVSNLSNTVLAVDSSGNVIATTTSGGGGSGTVNSGTAGQVAFYNSNGTAVDGTSTISFLNGNVGIGTTSPLAKLTIIGAGTGTEKSLQISDSVNSNLFSLQDNGQINIGYGAVIAKNGDFTGRSFTTGANLQLISNVIQTLGSADIQIKPYPGRNTLFTSGNLGIGTTTPATALSVVGTTTTQGLNISNLANTILAVDASGNVVATTTSGGSGTNYFTNSGATTTLTTGSILTAATGTFGEIDTSMVKFGGSPGATYNVLVAADNSNLNMGASTINLAPGGTGAPYTFTQTAFWSYAHPDLGATGIMFNNGYFQGKLYSAGVGIGTTTPSNALEVAGNGYFSGSLTAASTTATSTFAGSLNVANGGLTYNNNTGVTSIASLNTGALNFDTDAGVISWTDLPVDSTLATGTVESYSAQVGSTPVLTVYGESNGSGGIQNLRVGIGSTTPSKTLSIEGTFAVNSPGATSTITGNLDVAGNLHGTNVYSGDLIFQNDFRFTEASTTASTTPSGINGLYLRNQNGKDLLSVDENGNLTVTGDVCANGRECYGSSIAALASGLNALASSTAQTAVNASSTAQTLLTAQSSTNMSLSELNSAVINTNQILSSQIASLSASTTFVNIVASSTGATLASSTSFIQIIANAVVNILQSGGQIITSAGDWTMHSITAITGTFTNIFASRVQTQTAAVTNGIEMTSPNGQIWCVRVDNTGNFVRTSGSCDTSATSTPVVTSTVQTQTTPTQTSTNIVSPVVTQTQNTTPIISTSTPIVATSSTATSSSVVVATSTQTASSTNITTTPVIATSTPTVEPAVAATSTTTNTPAPTPVASPAPTSTVTASSTTDTTPAPAPTPTPVPTPTPAPTPVTNTTDASSTTTS